MLSVWTLAGGHQFGDLMTLACSMPSHARWKAKAKGGTINVYDQDGNLFKSIEVAPNLESDDTFFLPSI